MAKNITVLALTLIVSSVWAGEQGKSATISMKELLPGINCICDCNMTLEVCEKDDPTCLVRPLVIRKLEKLIAEGVTREEILKIAENEEISPARKAICQARREGKFQILFFYEEGSDKSDKMGEGIREAEKRFKDRATVTRININDGKEIELIREYRIWRAPTTLVMAPNGVITGGYQTAREVDDLEKALVSPKTVEIIGALQQRKVIFLLIQNEGTTSWQENLKAATAVADVLRKSATVIGIDPKDKDEKDILKQLGIEPNTADSITMVISPSGGIADRFEGKITNKDLFTSFKKVLAQKSGCGSGCGGG